MRDVIIVGGGIGGLTLALILHRAGMPCRVYESAPEIKEVGVGINILPHATRELIALGLEDALARVAVTTREAVFFNRFGQLIYSEPLGRYAGYDWPQFSIHRGELQAVLLDACRSRIGADRIFTGWRCVRTDQDRDGVAVQFRAPRTHHELPPQRGSVAVGCDGINSALRRQLYPNEGAPIYSGVNMWRGVTRWSFGRITLLGDAAHPMYPRGSNGAGQAILDARALADSLAQIADPIEALKTYEARRLDVTANVVRMNRSNPPDAILREVYLRSGDRPFNNIDDVISRDELRALSDGYKRVAGYDRATLGVCRT